MTFRDRIRRWTAPNAIQRQLYPKPSIEFRFRPYDEADRTQVEALYDLNAPDRFPECDRPHFTHFLNEPDKSYFVAEMPDGKIVASGGVKLIDGQINLLYYGLVAPEHQGMGIGTALVLARLAFATRLPGINASVILALPKSIGYYERFGYEALTTWKSDNGVEQPAGYLFYDADVIKQIQPELETRGLLVDPNLPISRSKIMQGTLIATKNTFTVEIKNLTTDSPTDIPRI